MKKIILFLFLGSIKFCSYGQNNDLPIRESFKLTLAVNDTNFYQTDIKASSYILPKNIIQIYPGETLYIEAEISKDTLSGMKSVISNLHPEKTIIISFTQTKEGKLHQNMILKIDNPFDHKLNYIAHMFLMKQKRWVKTDVLPVLAKKIGFETWADIIVTLALSDFKLQ